MGILVNFASDGQPAAGLVQKAVLPVMDGVHTHEGLLTLHVPFTTECARCLNTLCTPSRNSASEGPCEVRLAHSYITTRASPYVWQPAVLDALPRR